MAERNINKIARLEIPTVRIEDLIIGDKYKIIDMRTSNTKYGKKVMATLSTGSAIYLPARVSAALVEEPEEYAYHKMKVEEKKLCIRFLEGPYNKCEFLYEA